MSLSQKELYECAEKNFLRRVDFTVCNIQLRFNVPRDTVRCAIYWTDVNKAQNQTVLGPNP